MADWRQWDPSNKPETCLWCGRRLKYGTHLTGERDGSRDVKARNQKAGAYQDGAFCGLRCGYSFGVALALQRRNR
jgi:hypothetical protein